MRKRIARNVVMDALDGQALTNADLLAITGLTLAALTTALWQLRSAGMLRTQTLKKHSQLGRPRVIYSLAPL